MCEYRVILWVLLKVKTYTFFVPTKSENACNILKTEYPIVTWFGMQIFYMAKVCLL